MEPKPRNPKTLKPKPKSINPEPQSLNPEPSEGTEVRVIRMGVSQNCGSRREPSEKEQYHGEVCKGSYEVSDLRICFYFL